MFKKLKFNMIQKVVGVFALVLIPFFLFFGLTAQKFLEQQVVNNTVQYMKDLVLKEVDEIEKHFTSIERVGRQSADFIQVIMKRRLTTAELKQFNRKYKHINGALRSDVSAFPSEDISGVFLSTRGVLDAGVKRTILTTETRFDDYARALSGLVFNTYLITVQQLIRIYPEYWALEVEPEHDFTKDLFYFIADPVHNPEADQKWTEPYYDSICKHWMISLITPVYIDGEFFGIVGHDVILDDIYTKIMDKRYFKTGYGFIFDSKKNIIIHPQHLARLREKAEMGTKLKFSDIDNPSLRVAISNTIENNGSQRSVHKGQFFSNGKQFLFESVPLNFIDWYFGMVISSAEVTTFLPEFKRRFFGWAILCGMVVFLLVVLLVYFHFVSPITKLSRVVRQIRSGHLDERAGFRGRGEMADLAREFDEMTDELNSSMQKLKAENMERKQAEEALKESKNRFQSLVEITSDWIWETDTLQRFTFLSHQIRDILGYKPSQLIGKTPFDVISPGEKKKISEKLQPVFEKRAGFERLEHICIHEDGGQVVVESTGVPRFGPDGSFLGYRGIARDITHQKHAEQEKEDLLQQLQRAQKMEALGTLAGGVAHDLNNTLGAIVGYPDLLLESIPEDSSLRKSILAIKQSGERAAAIVQDLLTLARRGVNTTDVIDINDIVKKFIDSPECSRMREFNPAVEIKTELDPNLFNIIGSPIHLSKTVMNLVSNASEAMPKGGVVIVKTESRYLDKAVRGYDRVEEGYYVVLSVIDKGTGISSEDITKIFEPFYTKKIMGRSGTGLGMSVVWGTVKDHRGYIDVKSLEGEGTTFDLYFPTTTGDVKKTRKDASTVQYRGHGEKILVVDDVESQRLLASTILERFNYDVYSVASGYEAVEYLKTSKADLIVLDMIMKPGIDGLETYRRVLEIYPGQKAVIVSGFSETERIAEALRLGVGRYIKKPYSLLKLGEAVKEELGTVKK